MFTALAVATPLLFGAGLALRPDERARTEPSADLVQAYGQARPPGQPIGEHRLLGDSQGFLLEVRVDESSRVHLTLRPDTPLPSPEVLVYWASKSASELPDDARLLGRLNGVAPRSFIVPEANRGESGHLILYSLAHDEVVETLQLQPAWTSTVGAPRSR